MFTRDDLWVAAPRVAGHTVSYPFTCSPRLQRYFAAPALRVTYDVDVGAVPPSLLAVPAVANLVTVAWAAGADLHVETLDATFLDALEAVRRVFRAWYPGLPFTTTLHVDAVVENTLGHAGTGLLFSGGVDSTCSFLKHRARRPTLIMVNGTDPPWLVHREWRFTEEQFWAQLQATYREYAAQEGVPIHFVTTNMRDLLDEAQLTRNFNYYFKGGYWWDAFHYALALLSLCAPLTVERNIATLLNASDANALVKVRGSNRPQICDQVAWADVHVRHDGYPLTKLEKVQRYLRPHITRTGRFPPLRVCWSQFDASNCTTCFKCLRTVTILLLEGIDPNLCGFTVDRGTVSRLRAFYTAKIPELGASGLWTLRKLQASIPTPFPHDLYGSRAFFDWLRTYALPTTGRTPHPLIRLTPIAVRRHLPEPIKRLVQRHILKEDVDPNA